MVHFRKEWYNLLGTLGNRIKTLPKSLKLPKLPRTNNVSKSCVSRAEFKSQEHNYDQPGWNLPSQITNRSRASCVIEVCDLEEVRFDSLIQQAVHFCEVLAVLTAENTPITDQKKWSCRNWTETLRPHGNASVDEERTKEVSYINRNSRLYNTSDVLLCVRMCVWERGEERGCWRFGFDIVFYLN